MINWGSVPANSVLPFYFDSFGANGESITLTGLAVTDIEVYKGTSITQRSSDNGFALIDTDGIDVDSRTGIHGFSIDTSDNTDAGFYAAGSFYTVVVDAVTINSQTVRFVAGTFRLVAAENTAGVPVADTVRISGTTQTARDIGASVLLSSGTGTGQVTLTSGRVNADITHISASAVSTSTAQLGVNVVNAGGTAWGSGAITAASIANGAIDAATFAADVDAEILSYLVDDATRIDASALNTASVTTIPAILTDTAEIGAAGAGLTVLATAANLATVAGYLDTEIAAILEDTGTTLPAQIAALNNLSAAQVNAEVDTAISDAALATAANLATVDTVVDAIKAKTDSLTFTVAGQVDANIQYVNDVQVNGVGTAGNPWGP